jgi:hypothetical protein
MNAIAAQHDAIVSKSYQDRPVTVAAEVRAEMIHVYRDLIAVYSARIAELERIDRDTFAEQYRRMAATRDAYQNRTHYDEAARNAALQAVLNDGPHLRRIG